MLKKQNLPLVLMSVKIFINQLKQQLLDLQTTVTTRLAALDKGPQDAPAAIATTTATVTEDVTEQVPTRNARRGRKRAAVTNVSELEQSVTGNQSKSNAGNVNVQSNAENGSDINEVEIEVNDNARNGNGNITIDNAQNISLQNQLAELKGLVASLSESNDRNDFDKPSTSSMSNNNQSMQQQLN